MIKLEQTLAECVAAAHNRIAAAEGFLLITVNGDEVSVTAHSTPEMDILMAMGIEAFAEQRDLALEKLVSNDAGFFVH